MLGNYQKLGNRGNAREQLCHLEQLCQFCYTVNFEL